MLQVYQSDRGFLGNFFSIENVAQFSGDTLNNKEKGLANVYLERMRLLLHLQNSQIADPFLNYSKGNVALTSNFVMLNNFKIPIGLLELVFYGNGGKPDLDMTLNLEILGVNEFGYTFGIPFESFLWCNLKIFTRSFYMGIDPDSSSANIITSDIGLYGGGKYLIRQGIGVKDLGLTLAWSLEK